MKIYQVDLQAREYTAIGKYYDRSYIVKAVDDNNAVIAAIKSAHDENYDTLPPMIVNEI